MENTLRKQELETKLKSRGLEFRTDSALCAKYLQGTTDLNVDFIVDRMCQMKYLYEYCHMEQIKSQVYKEFIRTRSTGTKPESNVTSIAEKRALDTYSNGNYPDIYPWEKNKNSNWILNLNKIYIIIGLMAIPIAIHLYNNF
jgi:hypothetical protein